MNNENQPPEKLSLSKADIIKDAITLANTPTPNPNSMLDIRTGADWLNKAMQIPIPVKLFDKFWSESEVCILFADTNIGKSILAVQIADSISRGEAIKGFELEAPAQPVIYFDFELNCKQFENRYSNEYTDHYVFSPYFNRAEMKRGAALPEHCKTFEDCLIYCIEEAVHNYNARVLIIDNLTYLKEDNERARDAKPLMQELDRLKETLGLSILILAHTPKRDLARPIVLNDLQGSKMLMNFTDSCFCIGGSTKDKNLRYLKQIKVRNSEYTYTNDNVALCRIEKPHNFLGFTHLGFAEEREHLRERGDDNNKAYLIKRAKELKEEGMTYEEIGAELGIGKSSAERYVKK